MSRVKSRLFDYLKCQKEEESEEEEESSAKTTTVPVNINKLIELSKPISRK